MCLCTSALICKLGPGVSCFVGFSFIVNLEADSVLLAFSKKMIVHRCQKVIKNASYTFFKAVSSLSRSSQSLFCLLKKSYERTLSQQRQILPIKWYGIVMLHQPPHALLSSAYLHFDRLKLSGVKFFIFCHLTFL